MSKILVLQGIPASGKTTYAKQFMVDNPGYLRVNRDDLRLMFKGVWTPTIEKLVELTEFNIARKAIENDYNVIVDDTNLNPKYQKAWKDFADEVGAEIEFKLFTVSLEEAIKRDEEREHPVGAGVVKGFYERYKDVIENV